MEPIVVVVVVVANPVVTSACVVLRSTVSSPVCSLCNLGRCVFTQARWEAIQSKVAWSGKVQTTLAQVLLLLAETPVIFISLAMVWVC